VTLTFLPRYPRFASHRRDYEGSAPPFQPDDNGAG
jgi:hypothetical protein